MKFGQFLSHSKGKTFIKTFYNKCGLETSFSSLKMKLLKQVDYIEYIIAKLSKYVKISKQISLDSFSRKIPSI